MRETAGSSLHSWVQEKAMRSPYRATTYVWRCSKCRLTAMSENIPNPDRLVRLPATGDMVTCDRATALN